MRIHHLNCGTLCPISARLVNGEGGWFARGRMVCHCLLLESAAGLVLVDTGLGEHDVDAPQPRLGEDFLRVAGPRLDRAETALAQLQKLGFARGDVRHIVPTHLDLDHVGGLADFPEAEVHVFAAEQQAALRPATFKERKRYRPAQLSHGPRWRALETSGETWMGFQSVRAVGDEVLLIPLEGHTRGHCGVAVRDGEGWLLHAGDAYFFGGELDPAPRCPAGLAVFQRLMAHDDRQRRHNQRRLAELRARPSSGVRIFCAHDPAEL